jgi:hypothetical protein
MLIYSMSVSVDGFIADRDGAFEWTAPDEEQFRFRLAQIRELGGYLCGRKLYETMLPWETDPSMTAVRVIPHLRPTERPMSRSVRGTGSAPAQTQSSKPAAIWLSPWTTKEESRPVPVHCRFARKATHRALSHRFCFPCKAEVPWSHRGTGCICPTRPDRPRGWTHTTLWTLTDA